MPQHMGSLAPHVTRLSPNLGAVDGRSLSSSHGRRVVLTVTGQARRVTAPHVVAAAPEPSGVSLGQDAARIDASGQLITVMRKGETYIEFEMKVRDDELDEYGVVNNAIYASYIHTGRPPAMSCQYYRGRDLLLENLGISVDYWASTGNAMALSELNLKYFLPLRSYEVRQYGDIAKSIAINLRFAVMVRPAQINGVRIIIHHLIETVPDRKLVLEARATAICLNKDYRPTRVFPELSAKLREAFACKEGESL
ncbi:hypothetical protein ACP70R_011194 [Stipagrostis hirtigluma subsp. patula]